MRIALIHALADSMAPIHEAFAAHWPEADLADILDDSLSRDCAAEGLGPAMTERFLDLTRYAMRREPRGILFTCSAFGPCIEACARAFAPLPVLKPNEAMIEQAAAIGGRIGLLATFAPTLASIPAEFARAAPALRIEPRLVDGALAALAASDAATHDRLAVAAALSLGECDAIALAQFSLARAAPAIRAATGLPVLTTPQSAVRRLRKLVQG